MNPNELLQRVRKEARDWLELYMLEKAYGERLRTELNDFTKHVPVDTLKLIAENNRLRAALVAWHKEIIDGCKYDYDGTGWGPAMRAVWDIARSEALRGMDETLSKEE